MIRYPERNERVVIADVFDASGVDGCKRTIVCMHCDAWIQFAKRTDAGL